LIHPHPLTPSPIEGEGEPDSLHHSKEKKESCSPLLAGEGLGERSIATLTNFSFQRAEGTRHLGESIAKRFNISPYFGKDALASHLTHCQSPELLLIATHGYFSKSPQTPSTSHPEDPMLRSALAFAGANRWLEGKPLPATAEKGMIFAQDIAALDLWETELAILSACQTGIGDVKLGEGVFGLRRAFAIAGTKTLIMSLC